MAWRGHLSKSIRELRFLMCQSSPASSPARAFVEKNYKELKTLNPKLPILIRECSGVEPQLWARYENFCVRFTGKNYAAWEFQFKMFVKGKEMLGHIDGSSTAPTSHNALKTWETKDVQIITWILGSIEPQMVHNLRSFSTARDMWDHLKKIYNQDNATKCFQLELNIAGYKQNNLSIQDYYSGFLNMWADHSAILHGKVPQESLAAIQAVYETLVLRKASNWKACQRHISPRRSKI